MSKRNPCYKVWKWCIDQLLEALTKEGVEAIEAVGKQFDPHLHQAVMQVEDR